MNCPTCSHLLNRVGHVALWCARCGTMLTTDNGITHTPALVDRCRQFEANAASLFGDAWSGAAWQRLGIAEIIGHPE